MDHEELFIKRNVKAVEDSSSPPSPYASLRSEGGVGRRPLESSTHSFVHWAILQVDGA